MHGIRIFASLEEAQAAGFAILERTSEGYLVVKDRGDSFALAIAKLAPPEPAEKKKTRG